MVFYWYRPGMILVLFCYGIGIVWAWYFRGNWYGVGMGLAGYWYGNGVVTVSYRFGIVIEFL